MVMRSPSKEKALANLTSKSVSDKDQPVNSPFAWRHCWSNQSKFDYFSCVSCGRLCHLRMAILEKGVYKSKSHIGTRQRSLYASHLCDENAPK